MLLIDPKKLKAHYEWWGNEDMQRTLFDDIVDEQPTIDAEPVVRCADCKYFQCNMSRSGYLPRGVSEYECRHWCSPCAPTDFCSYGERLAVP